MESTTLIVDSASIEVERRGRRTKTDRLDAGKLLTMLIRSHHGEPKVCSVVHVPSIADEDRCHLHRDLEEMKAARTQHSNRMKGLLASCGLAVQEIGRDFPEGLKGLRLGMGRRCPWNCTNAWCASLPGSNSSTGRSGTSRTSAPDASARRSPIRRSNRYGSSWSSRDRPE